MAIKLVFLSDHFYNQHPSSKFPEIEQKRNRPYAMLLIKTQGNTWALPFRSHIKHTNSHWTNKASGCGIDFTKAVWIDPSIDIDKRKTPYLRPEEYNTLKTANTTDIEREFLRYIKNYKRAKKSQHPRYRQMLAFSTLQYFEDKLN